MQIKIMIFLGLFVFLSTLFGGAYLYYKNSQETIAQLNEQNATLSQAVDQQKEAIAALEDAIKEQAEIREEMALEIQSAKKDMEALQDKLSKHNLTLIASKKAELLEKKINKATDDVLRCFEVVTGAEVTANEKNNQCSDLFANP